MKLFNGDGEFRDIKQALLQEQRCFPPSVTIKISIAECTIDTKGHVRWRDRLLIPRHEPLQTALTHKAHDSPMTGHPGRESMLGILCRDFYWPQMSNMVRRFVRNCEICARTHVWHDKKTWIFKAITSARTISSRTFYRFHDRFTCWENSTALFNGND